MMRRLSLIFYISIVSINVGLAQSTSTKPYKLAEKGDFKKAHEKAIGLLDKDPSNALAKFSMSWVLKQTDPTQTHKAYVFACEALNDFQESSSNKQKEVWRELPFSRYEIITLIEALAQKASIEALGSNRESICTTFLQLYTKATPTDRALVEQHLYKIAFETAYSTGSSQAYSSFISAYPMAPQVTEAYALKDSIDFTSAQETNTLESWKSYIHGHPNSLYNTQAQEMLHVLAFEKVNKEHKVWAYEAFINTYPEALQIDDAKRKRDRIEYDLAAKINTINGWKHFIQTRPESEILEEAHDQLGDLRFLKFTENNSTDGMWDLLNGHPNSVNYSRVVDHLTDLALSQKNDNLLLQALQIVPESYIPIILNSALEHYSWQGEASHLDVYLDRYESYLINYPEMSQKANERLETYASSYTYDDFSSELQTRDTEFDPSYLKFLQSYKSYKWHLDEFYSLMNDDPMGVAKYLDDVQDFKLNNPWIDELYTLYNDQSSTRKAHPISSIVNSENSEILPVPSANGKHLYYCLHTDSERVYEDIYRSDYINDTWQAPVPISELNTPEHNEAPLNISSDGTEMIMFNSGSIQVSQKDVDGWGEAEPIDEINISEWNADAQLVSTKEAIIFASRINEDVNLFVALKDNNGIISEPMNMGAVLNTTGTERSPFLHPDMKSLYFSSDGHGGFGGLDVFISKRLHDSCWTCWSKPVNMGKQINSIANDWGFKISTDGQNAYFSKSGNDDGKYDADIYEITLPEGMRPDLVATVEGYVLDRYSQPLKAKIIWEDLEANEIIGEANTDPSNGHYFIVLPTSKIYGYFVDSEGYYPVSSSVDLREQSKFITVDEDVDMVYVEDVLEGDQDVSIPINNIFFENGSKELLTISNAELERLAGFILEHQIGVMLSGHTDDVGSEESNQILSEQRALSVKNVLIELGCPDAFLDTQGFGESLPVTDNTTAKGRQTNRRVVLTISK
jgi:outer membrane protein OmpA-like peptidoglycan-associated protein